MSCSLRAVPLRDGPVDALFFSASRVHAAVGSLGFCSVQRNSHQQDGCVGLQANAIALKKRNKQTPISINTFYF